MLNFKNNICTIPYTAKAGMGVIFPAKTTIINGENIIIISPGPLEEKVIQEIKQKSSHPTIIAPNNFHNMYIKQISEKFESCTLYGPKRAAKMAGIALTPMRELHNSLKDIKPIEIKGNKALGETVFFHPDSETLIVTDLFFNMRHEMNFMTRFAMLMAGTYQKIGTSRIIKFSIKDKDLFKDSLNELKSLPFKWVVPNHGDPISREEFIHHIDSNIL